MRLLVAPAAPLFLCALFTASAHAILVAPSSQCAVQCGNVLSSTTSSDLTCSDSAYASSVTGQTFESCISCELNSTYVDPITKQSDLQWLLCVYLILFFCAITMERTREELMLTYVLAR
jgi:hypothetical protein